MTGWGQSGPLAKAAGHDISYISIGGAMYLLCGLLAALYERGNSGRGQVIDAAMTDGTASLLSTFYGLMAMGMWTTERHSNRLDGGAPFYGSYECADGKYVSVGSLEPQFYALLLEKAGVEGPLFDPQYARENWPEAREKLAAVFRTRTREQWCEIMEGTDVCFAPVLDLDEAPVHPHNKARETFVEFEGVVQPAPAPRFSRTQGEIQSPVALVGEHSEQVLADWGFASERIAQLKATDAI